jgi:hypothetical protein
VEEVAATCSPLRRASVLSRNLADFKSRRDGAGIFVNAALLPHVAGHRMEADEAFSLDFRHR